MGVSSIGVKPPIGQANNSKKFKCHERPSPRVLQCKTSASARHKPATRRVHSPGRGLPLPWDGGGGYRPVTCILESRRQAAVQL